jgi:ubiquinone/menaquinone biosynthesis C-methylase UbiE
LFFINYCGKAGWQNYMSVQHDTPGRLFDEWPDRYDKWFETPVGALVRKYESELLIDFLKPGVGEMILDVGCGTGVFTRDILSRGPRVIGLDISRPMLLRANQKAKGYSFQAVAGDMISLPFAQECFDRVFSMTALEFIEDGQTAVRELFRVTKKRGTIVVTTLNSLSPWAVRRKQKAKKGHRLFQNMIFRSPDEMRALACAEAEVKTAIHFQKDEDLDRASKIEIAGQKRNLATGAFLAARWVKP